MQLILFIGIQAAGKSAFYKKYFFDSHVRINLDMLKTGHREQVLFETCLSIMQPCVIDKMNLTKPQRERYIRLAKNNGFQIHGYYFDVNINDALKRNRSRRLEQQVPDAAVFASSHKLEIPDFNEGFDNLFTVKIKEGNFEIIPFRINDL